MFPSRTKGGGRRFQKDSKLVPVRSCAAVEYSQAKLPPTAGRLLHFRLIESHVVADVEGVTPDRHRFPELDGQLILEQASRHALDRDRLAVVRRKPELAFDFVGIELLLGIVG